MFHQIVVNHVNLSRIKIKLKVSEKNDNWKK